MLALEGFLIINMEMTRIEKSANPHSDTDGVEIVAPSWLTTNVTRPDDCPPSSSVTVMTELYVPATEYVCDASNRVLRTLAPSPQLILAA